VLAAYPLKYGNKYHRLHIQLHTNWTKFTQIRPDLTSFRRILRRE
jgi:hypothetical protein